MSEEKPKKRETEIEKKQTKRCSQKSVKQLFYEGILGTKAANKIYN